MFAIYLRLKHNKFKSIAFTVIANIQSKFNIPILFNLKKNQYIQVSRNFTSSEHNYTWWRKKSLIYSYIDLHFQRMNVNILRSKHIERFSLELSRKTRKHDFFPRERGPSAEEGSSARQQQLYPSFSPPLSLSHSQKQVVQVNRARCRRDLNRSPGRKLSG